MFSVCPLVSEIIHKFHSLKKSLKNDETGTSSPYILLSPATIATDIAIDITIKLDKRTIVIHCPIIIIKEF